MPESTVVQTLILSKDVFTKAQANAWVTSHGFRIKPGAPDETEDSYRYRQRDPGDFQEGSFRTIEMMHGVSAVVGKLK